MKDVYVKSQKDFDKIKDSFEGYIYIKDTVEELRINRAIAKAFIYVYGNAVIQSVYGNAVIKYVYGNAVIKSVSDNAVIKYVYDNAVIKYVYGNAVIKSVSDNAVIQSVYGNAVIKYVYGNAVIKYVYDNAVILLITMFATIGAVYNAKKIVAKGKVIIRSFSKTVDIENTKSVTVIYQDKELLGESPTFKDYQEYFPTEKSGKKVLMYKTVHKKSDGVFFADYDKSFFYETGKTYEAKNAPQTDGACSYGLHVAYKDWAIKFGIKWEDVALIECEVDPKDIVVTSDCDGKVRTSKLTVIREVPKSEW